MTNTQSNNDKKIAEVLESIAHNCICKYKVENDGVARVVGVCVCRIESRKKEARQKLKALIKQSEADTCLALISRINKEVIGEDEEFTKAEADSKQEHVGINVSYYQKSSRNWVRRSQRTTLDTIKAEIEGSTE